MKFLKRFFVVSKYNYNDIENKILYIVRKNITLFSLEDLFPFKEKDLSFFAKKIQKEIFNKYGNSVFGLLLNDKNKLGIGVFDMDGNELDFLDSKILHFLLRT